jgi:hypothetical protein
MNSGYCGRASRLGNVGSAAIIGLKEGLMLELYHNNV